MYDPFQIMLNALRELIEAEDAYSRTLAESGHDEEEKFLPTEVTEALIRKTKAWENARAVVKRLIRDRSFTLPSHATPAAGAATPARPSARRRSR